MRFFKKSYVALVFLFLYAPILILMLYSFNDSRSRGSWGGFTLKWYKELFSDSAIMNSLLNTLTIAFLAAIIATVFGTAAAVGIHHMKRGARGFIMNISYLPVMNPDIVTGVSLMLLFLFTRIPMGMATLLLAHISFNIPYVILSVLPKLKQLNPHLQEAAEDLGASTGYAFFKVILPEISPGIVSGFLLSVTLSIDDFVVSFFTGGAGVDTLSVYIYAMARKGVNPSINALSTIMFAVVLTLLLVINRRGEAGETLG